jgi:hypothetical protein
MMVGIAVLVIVCSIDASTITSIRAAVTYRRSGLKAARGFASSMNSSESIAPNTAVDAAADNGSGPTLPTAANSALSNCPDSLSMNFTTLSSSTILGTHPKSAIPSEVEWFDCVPEVRECISANWK